MLHIYQQLWKSASLPILPNSEAAQRNRLKSYANECLDARPAAVKFRQSLYDLEKQNLLQVFEVLFGESIASHELLGFEFGLFHRVFQDVFG
jgi:hypothetical protein